MSLKNIAGSVAVITGGASGIGFATADALAARGAHVVLADINEPGLAQAREQLQQRNPEVQVHGVPTDVTNEEQVWELMRRAMAADGHIDLVITSAGIGRGGPIDSFAASEMQTMMNINFMGTYHCAQAALPAMREQGAGHFVFMSSVAGKLGVPFLSGYCASKWAVRGFSAALRAELYGTNIGVTTVYPAWVDTPMIHQEGDLLLRNIEALLTPEQVAQEIIEAVTQGRRDLTLAPNPEIALGLQYFAADQDRAEDAMGRSMQQQIAERLSQAKE